MFLHADTSGKSAKSKSLDRGEDNNFDVEGFYVKLLILSCCTDSEQTEPYSANKVRTLSFYTILWRGLSFTALCAMGERP